MKVSVVIPAYNVGHAIAHTLEAFLRQDTDPHEMELIVVDDGSTDDTREQIQQLPVRYVHQENNGAAAARNTGIAVAEGDIVIFIDSDCEPVGDSIRRLVEALEAEPEGTIFGGIYAPAQDLPLMEAAINEEIRYRHVRAGEQVQHVGGFCMAFWREHLQEIGDFDGSYKRSEDLDLSYRAVDRGYILKTSQDVSFIHRHPRTVWSWLKDQYRKASDRVVSVLGHSKVLKSDGYADSPDWALLLLALFSMAAIPFIWLPGVPWLILGSVGLSMALQIPLAAFAVRDTGDWRLVVLLPLQVLRGFAWAAGTVASIRPAVRAYCARSGSARGVPQKDPAPKKRHSDRPVGR